MGLGEFAIITAVLVLGFVGVRHGRQLFRAAKRAALRPDPWADEVASLGLRTVPAVGFFGSYFAGAHDGRAIRCHREETGSLPGWWCSTLLSPGLRLGLQAASHPGPASFFDGFGLTPLSEVVSSALPGWHLRATDPAAARQLLDGLGSLAKLVAEGYRVQLNDDALTLVAPDPGSGGLAHILDRLVSAAAAVEASASTSKRPA